MLCCFLKFPLVNEGFIKCAWFTPTYLLSAVQRFWKAWRVGAQAERKTQCSSKWKSNVKNTVTASRETCIWCPCAVSSIWSGYGADKSFPVAKVENQPVWEREDSCISGCPLHRVQIAVVKCGPVGLDSNPKGDAGMMQSEGNKGHRDSQRTAWHRTIIPRLLYVLKRPHCSPWCIFPLLNIVVHLFPLSVQWAVPSPSCEFHSLSGVGTTMRDTVLTSKSARITVWLKSLCKSWWAPRWTRTCFRVMYRGGRITWLVGMEEEYLASAYLIPACMRHNNKTRKTMPLGYVWYLLVI